VYACHPTKAHQVVSTRRTSNLWFFLEKETCSKEKGNMFF
jgi:hypothetical protein